jgi:hypothetical protein
LCGLAARRAHSGLLQKSARGRRRGAQAKSAPPPGRRGCRAARACASTHKLGHPHNETTTKTKHNQTNNQTIKNPTTTKNKAAVVHLVFNPLQRWRYRRIPGPPFRPLFGDLPSIRALGSHVFMAQCARRYGPVCKVFMGGGVCV